MIKGFQEFINESEERDEAADLRRLNRLGVIGDKELILALARLAREKSTDLLSMLGTVKPVIELKNFDGYAEEHMELIKEWLLKWRGHKGEKIAMATGDISEEEYSLEILISNGDEVTLESEGRGWDATAELRVGDATFDLDEDKYYDFMNQYYDEHKEDPDLWSKMEMARLSMIVALGY
jgi:hypothetical protein